MKIDFKSEILKNVEKLEMLNKNYQSSTVDKSRDYKLKKVLVVNRGEIAKRFFLALHEENIPSVAVVTEVDRGQSWYEFADEVVYIGEDNNYTNIAMILAAVDFSGANAVYAGYGFLSENYEFVEALNSYDENVIFMGPNPDTMKLMGDKVSSRELAEKNGIPLFKSSEAFDSVDIENIEKQIDKIGYPVIVKLSSGGGGKGMYPVFSRDELPAAVESCCRIGKDLYNDSRFYVEKFIQKPVHIEVQVFNGRAVGIRKCAVQRRNQKIIEESGNAFLEDHIALSFLSSAEKLAIVSGYEGCGAGTVEFLIDSADGSYGFMEMNTRLQVEYGVTDQTLDIDLAKWQILYFDGRLDEISGLDNIKFRIAEKRHAIECRIYAEEPENDYRPSPGKIKEIVLPTFNGIRCDFGFSEGDSVLPMYDPMIGKLISFGSNREEAIIRMERALQELYIRGIKTNINQLINIVRSENFSKLNYTNNILNENPELCFDKNRSINIDNKYFLFAAFTEHVKDLKNASVHLYSIIEADGILSDRKIDIPPYSYAVKYEGLKHSVSFMQLDKETFITYVDGVYSGDIKILSSNRNADDYLIEYEEKTKRIRVDRFIDYNSIRIKDDNNKIKYLQMTIVAEGTSKENTEGRVCSPFQGTFVNFASDKIKSGAEVKKGDPLLILSAMKMETVIEAPIDGVIDSIIEDGDMSRLQLSVTSDGRILGKSIQEGEVLVNISQVSNNSNLDEKISNNVNAEHVYEKILFKEYLDNICASPEEYFDYLLDMFYAMVRGYIYRMDTILNLKYILQNIESSMWSRIIDEKRSDKICRIILHYANIKKLFSPVVNEEGLSFSEELDIYIRSFTNGKYLPSEKFSKLFEEMFRAYYGEERRISDIVFEDIENSILFTRNAYKFSVHHWPEIARRVEIVGNLCKERPITKKTLRRLYEHTLYQLDDTSTKFIRNVFAEYFPEEGIEVFTEQYNENAVEIKTRDLSDFSEKYSTVMPEVMKQSIKLLDSESVLYNSDKDIYFSENKDFSIFMKYICVPNGKALRKISNSFSEILSYLDNTLPDKQTFLDLYIDGSDFNLDSIKSNFNPNSLKKVMNCSLKYFMKGILKEIIVHIVDGEQEIYPLRFNVKGNRLVSNFAFDGDSSYLYCVESAGKSDLKMYNLDKLPYEKWLSLCFDNDSCEEIKIDSIDANPEIPQTGAAIFKGLIDNSEVCFYMKDYRYKGGATGDLEGLKYGAACYYAYMKGIPLYVWNDSAGANIKEGVVSLNRGGQGFMMNSLLSNNVGIETFNKYIDNIYDEKLKSVIDEVRIKYSLSEQSRLSESTMVVAVGVGASAGLDVYGSSQATVQVILDSESSYRVLTGSNVIKSVLGEDISNYDIGGAGVLGKWTGIADIVASDKPDLISKIFEIQNLFCKKEYFPEIKRVNLEALNKKNCKVLDAEDIRKNADFGKYYEYKNEYYASNSLLCGFVKLAGERVLVAGPRTDYGIRSESSIIKARDIFKIADKTDSAKVIICGKKWINPGSELNDVRHITDMTRTLNDSKTDTILIITDPGAFREIELVSSSDMIIYIDGTKLSKRESSLVEKNSDFIVDSMSEAFDTVSTYLGMINRRQISDYKISDKLPSIPHDASVPFNIIDDVINCTFDEGSFLEFGSPFNKPTGPNLVTGLARLKGETVGIIADQPMIKGGGADSPGTKKFRIFTEFLNKHNVPLVMLSNSSGFVPGTQQERYRIQAVGGESLDANILGNIPVASVVLNQNYGGRQIHAFSKSLRPGITYVAFEDSTIAVMGATAAFDLLGVRKYYQLIDEGENEEAETYKNEFLENYKQKSNAGNDAASTSVIDWTFKRDASLREEIIKALINSKEECQNIFQ